jgi:uncharacterized protein (TIGR00252 family)
MVTKKGPLQNTKQQGDAAESRALAWLLARGLRLEARNYRVARGPHARGGEIDLVMRDADGTLVFVEVRQRRGSGHGGAAASVGGVKRNVCCTRRSTTCSATPQRRPAASTCWRWMATVSSGCKPPSTPVPRGRPAQTPDI